MDRRRYNKRYMTEINVKTTAGKYNHQEIEKKWQEKWAETGLYHLDDEEKKPKFYVLDMFPYPSGAGLHVGHPKGYIATDVVAREKMMQGYKVLHPMGWDAFGLPAENFALKNRVHPKASTEKNIEVFKKQLSILGFTYDWTREINTTDPQFYRWTQWIFEQMYGSYYDAKLDKAEPIEKLIREKFSERTYAELNESERKIIDDERLAFEDFAPINWCPSCKTGLANEDLEDGRCERCGSVIEKKPLRQWNLRITKYAERLLGDLKDLAWENSIKVMQENWIGRSEGAVVKFAWEIAGVTQEKPVTVFTTRADTLFGVTYVVIAPEKVVEWGIKVKNQAEVAAYVETSRAKVESERTDMTREKTGVCLAGVTATNPLTGEKVPVWVADYVVGDYGTGAVMAVPAHDERDWAFAQKYGLPVKQVIAPNRAGEKEASGTADGENEQKLERPVVEDGWLMNSGKYDGLKSDEARRQIVADLASGNYAEKKVNYKLREWVFSRQRYWGEPIPIIHCKICGNVAVPEEKLPVELPAVEHYEPSGTGESPLVNMKEWVETTCPICGAPATRETNTMPQWAGSSWYYLRYLDPCNQEKLVTPEKEREMMPVDLYVGGAEHATRHLIYARFYHKFLYDRGVVSTKEPFTRLQHVGLILAEDGRKMSKRWGNVINPDEIAADYGADALRVYEMFMGPFAQPAAWSTQGVAGVRKFLEKVWQLRAKVAPRGEKEQAKYAYTTLLHQTIVKVTTDIEEFKFNTVVSALMILANKMQEEEVIARADYGRFLQLLAPLAPHVTEELWASLGEQGSIFRSSWPVADPKLAQAETKLLPIQVNGKLRDQVEIATADLENEELVWRQVWARAKIAAYLAQGELVKKIYVAKKIVNLVIKNEES